MEHTKSEWQIADEDKRFVFATDKDGYNAFTCLVQGGSAFIGELEANAQLIAAAPDLLAALERDAGLANAAIAATPTGKYRNKLTELNILRLEAIAKAKL